jgi:hypothetical protein
VVSGFAVADIDIPRAAIPQAVLFVARVTAFHISRSRVVFRVVIGGRAVKTIVMTMVATATASRVVFRVVSGFAVADIDIPRAAILHAALLVARVTAFHASLKQTVAQPAVT